MRIARNVMLCGVLALGAASAATAQAPPLPDVDGLGPQVGDVVPSLLAPRPDRARRGTSRR